MDDQKWLTTNKHNRRLMEDTIRRFASFESTFQAHKHPFKYHFKLINRERSHPLAPFIV